MIPEWVAVPSAGMRRWLPLELAKTLGASAPGAGDGVAANMTLAFPGILRSRVLEAGRDPADPNPWQIERLTWFVLGALDAHAGDPALAAPSTLPAGASRYSRARRVADAFDRYHLHRPDMVLAWLGGADTDAMGLELAPHQRWQPALWRLVRDMVGEPSPPERLGELLAGVAAGQVAVDLPDRLSVFGVTVLPGGASFLDLVHALASTRDVHFFLLEASPLASTLAGAWGGAWGATGGGSRLHLRSEDESARAIHHPLLQSWGRLQRESSVLLAGARDLGYGIPEVVDQPESGPTPTVLTALQDDIRENRHPSGSIRLVGRDASVRFHSCHGPTRQVEVLRDAILHLLADETLGLVEDDILVACPDLGRFAPLVEGVWGPSADDPALETRGRAPALRYRIADRSVGDFNAVLAATSDLIDLVGGRFEASAVLDFLALEPVRARARLDDEQLGRIGRWAADANVRWGLDPTQRERFGLPASIETNTWRSATDRLLLGAAISDGSIGLALGDTAIIGTEGDDVDTVGRVADVLEQLATLAEESRHDRPITAWVDLLKDATSSLFDVPPAMAWQVDGLWRLLDDVSQSVPEDPVAAATRLTYTDVRRLFGERLGNTPGRPDFFRGGITVSSLTPLRGIPFRVICLLGMDESAFKVAPADGDDLGALTPVLGDPDRRAEFRLSLLELVMAAGDRLILTRDGYDVQTNHEIPAAVVVEELREAVVGTIVADERAAFSGGLESEQPRQGFDEKCFTQGRLLPGVSWGFDPSDLAGAEARRTRSHLVTPFLAQPLVDQPAPSGSTGLTVDLATLHRFLKNPVKAFVEQRLGVPVPPERRTFPDVLPIAPAGLEAFAIGDRLVRQLRAGGTEEMWARIEPHLGTLPPAVLGEAALEDFRQSVGTLIQRATALGWQPGPGTPAPVEISLNSGIRIVGSVPVYRSESSGVRASVLFTRGKPVHRIEAWLDLLALVVAEPHMEWRSVLVARELGKGQRPMVLNFAALGDTPEERTRLALSALEVIVACYRQGMREPIPLFPTVSYQLHIGRAREDDWRALFGGRGDATDAAISMVYGHLEYEALLGLPCQPQDLFAGGSRVYAFADYLFGAMDRSVEDVPAVKTKAKAKAKAKAKR
jgi:exodeoxyribonuclease V gamma subunit